MRRIMKKVRSYGSFLLVLTVMSFLLSGCGYVEWWFNSADYNAGKTAEAGDVKEDEEQSFDTEAEPEAASVAEAETQPAAEAETEPAAEPVAEAETAPAEKPVAEAETAPAAEPVNETETEPAAKPVAETETKPVEEPVPEVEAEPAAETGSSEFTAMGNVETNYIDVEGPVMQVTLLGGETVSGPLSSVQTHFTSGAFAGLSMTGFTHLTRREEGESIIFEMDDVYYPSVEWSLHHSVNDYTSPDVQDQSFSIMTEDGVRLISMLNVKEIFVEDNGPVRVPDMEDYERPEPLIIPGEQLSFETKGTVLVHLKDGTVYTSYPGCFPKFSTANNYLYPDDQPGYSQTRDFWMEEARTLSFKSQSESESGGRPDIYEVSGTLAGGEQVRKFIVATGNEMRLFTKENGIIAFPFSSVDHIEVDMTSDADFSDMSKVRVGLNDGTTFEMPASAMEYVHYEGGGMTQPHPLYDDFFYTGSAEFSSDTGYAEEEKELLFSEIMEVVFEEDPSGALGKREFPAEVTYRDGTSETLNFRFFNLYGNALEFYCPFRVSYNLNRYNFMIKSITFD